jgi:hypothetical protein
LCGQEAVDEREIHVGDAGVVTTRRAPPPHFPISGCGCVCSRYLHNFRVTLKLCDEGVRCLNRM